MLRVDSDRYLSINANGGRIIETSQLTSQVASNVTSASSFDTIACLFQKIFAKWPFLRVRGSSNQNNHVYASFVSVEEKVSAKISIVF